MNVILIAGFWLDGSSWDEVAPAVRAAGHTVLTPTLPGLERGDIDRSGITLQDHIDAVLTLVDASPVPVVVVGHSGGGAIAHAVADARPHHVARVIYVDSGPLPHGGVINDELPDENGEIPLPDWAAFEDAELADFDEAGLAALRARAIPHPLGVATSEQQLSDPRRYDVPVTVITSTFPSAAMREMMAADSPFTRELARVKDVTIVDLPTGHWPQFTKPVALREAIIDALR